MLESRPRLKKFLGACTRYIIGFLIGMMLASYLMSVPGVPSGVYAPLYSGQGASFQINATNGKQEGNKLTVWVREDRNAAFMAESGISGQTVISNVEIVCGKQPNITIIEQRSFSNLGRQMGRWEGRGIPNNPESLMSFVALVKVCGIAHQGMLPSSPEVAPRKKQPSFIA